MNGCEFWLLAASNVFSAFGLLYVAIPVALLLVAAWLVSRWSGSCFWPLVFGAVAVIIAVAVVACVSARSPDGLVDRNLPVAVNAAACVGAVSGVTACAGLRAVTHALAGGRSEAVRGGPVP